MILEHLEKLLRDEAQERSKQPNNPFRASSMGRCIREGCFDLLGLPPEALQPRRMLTLHHGTVIHDDLLTPLIKKAMGWRAVDGKEVGDNFVEIDGVKISYHFDVAFQHTEGSKIGVAEIKSMSDFAFNRALKGEIDHDYLCQAWIYHKGTDFDPVVFLAFRKNTGAMVEIVFSRNCLEKVVTQRLTGDPIELAREDPILLTEIQSPFDNSVEEYVRERIRWLKWAHKQEGLITDIIPDVLNEVPGADAIEDEIEKVQGGEKAALLAKEGKLVIPLSDRKGNSWYSFKTGRKVVGYPCNYCAHMKRCYPEAQMEMKGERPVWVV